MEVRMRKCFLLFLTAVLLTFLAVPASALNYEFYHFALRDYNGDGIANGKDHYRYGFKVTNDDGSWADTTNWQAVASGHWRGDDRQPIQGGHSYYGAFNSQTYSKENYWKASFEVLNSTIQNNITKIELFDGDSKSVARHFVHPIANNPNDLPSYGGFDSNSVTWSRTTDGYIFRWDPILTPSSWSTNPMAVEDSDYKFSLANWDGPGYEILFSVGEGQKELFLSDDLLGVSDAWTLQFQRRFINPWYSTEYCRENYHWLRSYGKERQISLKVGASSVPEPTVLLLLGIGIVGLAGVRKVPFFKI